MQAALAAEVAVKMRALLEEIAEAHSEGVWAAVRLVEDADVALASARSAHELRLVRPSWRAFPGCGLRARGLRHPIVEALLERRGRQVGGGASLGGIAGASLGHLWGASLGHRWGIAGASRGHLWGISGGGVQGRSPCFGQAFAFQWDA